MRSWQAAHSQGPTRLADLHLGVLEVQLSSPVAHLSLCSVGQHPEPTDWGQASAAWRRGGAAAGGELIR
jgi:hypothetical protein